MKMPRKGERFPVVCSAHRTNGEPCKAPPLKGQRVCRVHGGSTRASKAAAQERINASADSAARHLIEWMNDKKVPYNIRIAAAKDLLDRAQIGTDKNVKVELRRFEQDIEGLFVDVVDAEVVEDQPSYLPARRQR